MKIFQAIILNISNVGIIWPQKHKKHPFNAKNLTILFNLGLYSVLAVLFLLLEAETFSEYADSFYLIVTNIFCAVLFATTIWKTPKIFELITSFETIIQKRGSNCRLRNQFHLIMN